MKKYIIPSMQIVILESETILSGSTMSVSTTELSDENDIQSRWRRRNTNFDFDDEEEDY